MKANFYHPDQLKAVHLVEGNRYLYLVFFNVKDWNWEVYASAQKHTKVKPIPYHNLSSRLCRCRSCKEGSLNIYNPKRDLLDIAKRDGLFVIFGLEALQKELKNLNTGNLPL